MMITRIASYMPKNTNFGRKYDYEGYALVNERIMKSITQRNNTQNQSLKLACDIEIDKLSKIAKVAGNPDYNDDTTIKKYLKIWDALGNTNIQIYRISSDIHDEIKNGNDQTKINQLRNDQKTLEANREKLFEMKEALEQKILSFAKKK